MKRRYALGGGLLVLAVLMTLVVWQGSFSFGDLGPASPEQVPLFWAMSTTVFLLTVALGFMLFRDAVKLYMERRRNVEGSRIKFKLVAGALVLSFLPVFFMVLWSVSVLNLNLDKWFSRPAQNVRLQLVEVGESMMRDAADRARAQAHWLAETDEIQAYAAGGPRPEAYLARFCSEYSLGAAWIERRDGTRLPLCPPDPGRRSVRGTAPVRVNGAVAGDLNLSARMPIDLEAKEREIQRYVSEYDQLGLNRKDTRKFYLMYLLLITLFILFVATWIALFLAKQISVPITALLDAAGQVRKGNLGYRVQVGAMDEIASLVRAFNEMTQALEANSRELERRRRFTETILESIPTGVISATGDGKIQKVNRALKQIFPGDLVERAARLEDLFSREDSAELRYLMKRARRTGLASRQLELLVERKKLHLSVTVSALEERASSGFVIVLEDTSELLRAQKAAAWHEVARRIAHEIKNPLTPIALSADRIARQLDRVAAPAEFTRIVRECTGTIIGEVESVKTLVDEFSQFARFPAAQLQPSDLNETVDNALAVFAGRLDGITVQKSLAPNLPPVNLDREQFRRAVVNLVDNAAEAMQESLVKNLIVMTQSTHGDTIELIVSDTGAGISAEDKEKLFLPYFSTKGRGTGLGLAIVNHILADHHATIRVEDNTPAGARFIVEIPAPAAGDAEENGAAAAPAIPSHAGTAQ